MNTKMKSAIAGTIISLICVYSSESHAQSWQWGQLYGGGGHDVVSHSFIDAADNIYVSGETQGGLISPASSNAAGFFISKLSPGGSVAWTKGPDMVDTSSGGGVKNFYMSSMTKNNAASGIYTAGNFVGSVTFGNGIHTTTAIDRGVFVNRYDMNGNLYWASTSMVSVSVDAFIGISDVLSLNNGDFVICGYFAGDTLTIGNTPHIFTDGFYRAFAVLCDSSGIVKNELIYSTQPSLLFEDDEFIKMKSDAQNNIYLLGNISKYTAANVGHREIAIIKCNSLLQPTYTKTLNLVNDLNYGASDFDVATNGDFYISGYGFSDSLFFGTQTFVKNLAIGSIPFLVKYNNAGAEQWVIQTGFSITDILLGQQQGIYIAGTAHALSPVGSHTPTGSIFLANYSNSGTCNWADFSNWNIACPVSPTCVLESSLEEVYLTGTIRDSLSFGNTIFHNTFPTPGSCPLSDAFVVKYEPGLAGINSSTSNQSSLVVYPNPNNGQFNVKLSSEAKVKYLQVINIIGEVVYSIDGNVLSGQTSIDVSSLSSGTYFVTIVADEKSSTEKMVLH